MGCIRLTDFVVLAIGEPTNLFKSSRGLKWGCPLSPLLFLVIVEGMSRLILKSKVERSLKGINLSLVMKITHLPFVDDAILFGNGTLEE